MAAIVNSPVTRQTDILAQLRADVDQLQAASRINQMNYSALHNTALPIYGLDESGNTQIKARLGKQPDGTYAIKYENGAAPPAPSNIGVAERQLGILITWDGSFTGNVPKPGNFLRLDIYIDPVSGFVPSVDNLMGSLFSESALFIGADTSIHYVRVVAVNTSDVPSSMTPEVSVTPLPANQLAAGSVGAIQLEAEIILGSRIVIGDPSGGRLSFSDVGGLELFKPDGVTRTVHLDPDTGDFIATGTWKTAESGSRIEGNPGGSSPDKFRLFPGIGTNYAELTVDEVTISGQQYAIIYMNASSARVGNQTGFVFTYPDSAAISWQAIGQPEYSLVEVSEFQAKAKGPTVSLESLHTHPADANGYRVALTHVNSSGVVYTYGTLDWVLNAANVGYLRQLSKDVGLVFETQGIHSTLADGTTHCPMYASAFTVISSVLAKENFQQIPFDSFLAILNAPSKSWTFTGDKTNPRHSHIGPIAEDLPSQLQRDMNGDFIGVDVGSLVGVLWDAVSRLITDNENLQVQLAQLSDTVERLTKG